MNESKLVIYFLTENVHVEKERNELEYLRKLGRVVLVSNGFSEKQSLGIRYFNLKPQSRLLLRSCILWSKACYFFCKIAKTKSDQEFTVRNVYSGNTLIRFLVNLAWKIKILRPINSLLPTYDALYFFPFVLFQKIFGKKKSEGSYRRLVVHDSLALRLNKFPCFVAFARANKIPTIGNVKSWDNPFYSQLSIGVDGYLVWSDSMWKDVQAVHGVPEKFIHVWGARPFYQFYQGLKKFKSEHNTVKTNTVQGPLVIGYAAAFCDELMGRHEINVIKVIATHLEKNIPSATLLIRPYPIIPLVFYSELAQFKNVNLVEIGGEVTKYDDGKKQYEHRIGSDLERFEYLSKCNCFLSIATSFTIEAAMFGLPIVHFYLEPEDRKSDSEKEFFKRIEISDHLIEYFNKELVLSSNYEDLVSNLGLVENGKSDKSKSPDNLLKRIGVPFLSEDWKLPSGSLKKDLSLLKRS